MLNGLLICSGEERSKNIGDYIQSVAQEQFFDHIDCYVERESMNTFTNTEKTNVIMNSWFMWHPENFPPSAVINPLFISFHIVPTIAERLLTNKTVDYLKQHEPIGARDFTTQRLLESHGIKSYFSGCLTLTLGLKYKSDKKTDEIIFVDPYYELGWGNKYSKIIQVLSSFIYVVEHFGKINKLKERFINERITKLSKISSRLERLLFCASFYHYYSTLFEDTLLYNAVYIKHEVPQKDFKNEDEKMEYARVLLRRYSEARLVITSRIHCALPCLGIETPVLFVTAEDLEKGFLRSPGRFEGLTDLLNIVKWTSKGLTPESVKLKESLGSQKIGENVYISNPVKYVPLKEKLIRTVNQFINNSIAIK